MSTDLASPAICRLHFVTSEFRPPSVTESGEAALGRLLAKRAIGGYSVTSEDRTLGFGTVFQSSRVARPQDASRASYFVSLLSNSARYYLDANTQRLLRLVSEVADFEARLGPPSCFVDPVFQHSQRHYVGFICDLVKAGSVGFVTTAVEHFGLFVVAKKAGAGIHY